MYLFKKDKYIYIYIYIYLFIYFYFLFTYIHTYIHIYTYRLFICFFYLMNSDIDMPRKFTYKPCRLSFLNPCSMDHPARYMPKHPSKFIMIYTTKLKVCQPSFCVHSRHGFGQWFGLWHQFDICSLAVNLTGFPPNGPFSEGAKGGGKVLHGAFNHLLTGIILQVAFWGVVSFGFLFLKEWSDAREW